MGVIRIWALTLFLAVLMTVNSVHAENPSEIWCKESGHQTGIDVIGELYTRSGPLPQYGILYFDYDIGGISLSRDGKLVGYQTKSDREGISKYFVVNGSTTYAIGDYIDYLGFVWDEDNIVGIKSPNNFERKFFFYDKNGTSIKNVSIGLNAPIYGLDISSNGKFIGIASAPNKVQVYDDDGNLLTTFEYVHIGPISNISISNSGEVVFFMEDKSRAHRGFVLLYNLSGELMFRKEIELERIFVEISNDGQRTALGVNDPLYFVGVIFLDNYGNELWRYKTDTFDGEVQGLKVVNDDEYSVVFGYKKFLEILNEDGQEIVSLKVERTIDSVSVSERGRYIVSSHTGSLCYFNNAGNVRPTIIVLANSIDYELASDFFKYLSNNGCRVIYTNTSNFDHYKSEEFLVILGGPDAYGGVGDVVREVLMDSEQNQTREEGNQTMYVKTNVWTQSQKVMVIAGSDREETKASHQDNQDRVLSEAVS